MTNYTKRDVWASWPYLYIKFMGLDGSAAVTRQEMAQAYEGTNIWESKCHNFVLCELRTISIRLFRVKLFDIVTSNKLKWSAVATRSLIILYLYRVFFCL